MFRTLKDLFDSFVAPAAGQAPAQTGHALQLAAALAARCTAFLTNDRRLPHVAGLQVLQLGAYL